MNLVKIDVYAEGHYSGNTYEEVVFLTEDTYNKAKKEIDTLEMYIYDLDGKHSEVKADIDIEIMDTERLLKEEDISCTSGDDDNLFFRLSDILEEEGIKIGDELDKVSEHIKSLDTKVTINITIKRSQKEEVVSLLEGVKGISIA